MTTIERYGWQGEYTGKGVVARVTSSHGDYYHVICDAAEGEIIARKKSSAYHQNPSAIIPTTGDFVVIKFNPAGESRILETLPRFSKFERADPSANGRRKAQVVAVNFNTLFLMMSLNRNFNVRRLERFVAIGQASGAECVVLLTKSDLVDDELCADAAAEAREAIPNTIALHTISATTGHGIAELAARYVKPRQTLAFIGSSGVGKSTLVNALAGDEWMRTGEIQEWDDKGRHTTTERELVMLPSGAMVIDTPGMREIGVWEGAEAIGETFADVEQLFSQCRFSDCRHETEPGCAVKAALASGALDEERWLAYQRLQAEKAGHSSRFISSGTHRFR